MGNIEKTLVDAVSAVYGILEGFEVIEHEIHVEGVWVRWIIEGGQTESAMYTWEDLDIE